MTDQPGCDCEICETDYKIAFNIHDYVWEGEDEQDVRGEV